MLFRSVTIICVLSLFVGCCIKADTTVLVSAPLILGKRVKCIPIYLVPFESQYSRRWLFGQQVQLFSNIIVIHEMCSQPTVESLHVVLCNPVVRLPRVVGAYNILVLLDIRSHQDGTLQNSVVCFIERKPVRTSHCFLS